MYYSPLDNIKIKNCELDLYLNIKIKNTIVIIYLNLIF
jgi:hypothetical protein